MMRKSWLLRAVTAALVVCLACSAFGLYGTCEEVRHSVLRLHILANSDSDADQALKLRVRDAVTAAAAGWLDGAADLDEAKTVAAEKLAALEAVALETVADAGADYPVRAELCRMYFPTRQYDDVTLPAGEYDAVRFTIGAGAGHNWWCVVFPPLCVGAAADRKTLAQVLSPAGQSLVGGRYVVKFKIVEWAEALLRKLKR